MADNSNVVTLYRACQDEAARLAISSFLDGEADRAEQLAAQQHLANCPDCRRLAATWSCSRAGLLQSARNPELDRLAAAIAGQTRAWLQTELLARPRPIQRVPNRRGGLVGAAAALVTLIMVSIAVFYMSLLSSADLKPTPVITARVSAQPATIINLAGSPSPAGARADLSFTYQPPRLPAPRTDQTAGNPALAGYTYRYYATPGVSAMPSPRN